MSNLDDRYTKRKCDSAIKSIKTVLDTHNMDHLNTHAYFFVTMNMGFIAHYSRDGFIGEYRNRGVDAFAENLITGEINMPDYNERHAQRFMSGSFNDQFSPETARRIGKTIKSIVDMAKKKRGE